MTNLDELLATAHQLRAPGGCPWDAEQTHESLVQAHPVVAWLALVTVLQ